MHVLLAQRDEPTQRKFRAVLTGAFMPATSNSIAFVLFVRVAGRQHRSAVSPLAVNVGGWGYANTCKGAVESGVALNVACIYLLE